MSEPEQAPEIGKKLTSEEAAAAAAAAVGIVVARLRKKSQLNLVLTTSRVPLSW
jgi:hypothetical protein